eukprot:UN12362
MKLLNKFKVLRKVGIKIDGRNGLPLQGSSCFTNLSRITSTVVRVLNLGTKLKITVHSPQINFKILK